MNEARVNEVAEALQGTCQCLEDHTTSEEQDDAKFLHAIDELIFCCATCGWWCEVGDMAENENEVGDIICTDCEDE